MGCACYAKGVLLLAQRLRSTIRDCPDAPTAALYRIASSPPALPAPAPQPAKYNQRHSSTLCAAVRSGDSGPDLCASFASATAVDAASVLIMAAMQIDSTRRCAASVPGNGCTGRVAGRNCYRLENELKSESQFEESLPETMPDPSARRNCWVPMRETLKVGADTVIGPVRSGRRDAPRRGDAGRCVALVSAPAGLGDPERAAGYYARPCCAMGRMLGASSVPQRQRPVHSRQRRATWRKPAKRVLRLPGRSHGPPPFFECLGLP